MALTLLQRLFAKIPDNGGEDACALWTGATRLSRTTRYGCIQEAGRGSRLWRAHRLVLLCTTGPSVCPQGADEDFLTWLHHVDDYYKDRRLEASHQCDQSLCCNPGHLRWETRVENEVNQIKRRQEAREAVSGPQHSEA